jgi:hypothetical protein
MKVIEETRTFGFTLNLVYKNLLEVFKHLQIELQSENPETKTIIGYWKWGAVQFIIEAVCTSLDENSTEINLVYRPDLIPIGKRPYGMAKEKLKEKMEQIFVQLNKSLEPKEEYGILMAIKFERVKKKFQWLDWVIWAIIIVIYILVSLMLIITGNTYCMGGGFAFGFVLAALYIATIRRYLINKYPHIYKYWICSNCDAEMSKKEYTVCPQCNAKFRL